MPHVFLSYVRENQREVDYLAAVLRQNEVEVWKDRDDLRPGIDWRDQLRDAIHNGGHFVPLFSQQWVERERTQANEELIWAVEELRRRPNNSAWFIALSLDGAFIDREIGAGRRLSDIQYLPVHELGWRETLYRLLRALGSEDPQLDPGEPLAPGIHSQVKLISGRFAIDEVEPAMPHIHDLEFQLASGTIFRDDRGQVVAQLLSRAPNTQLQALNAMLGLDAIECRTDAPALSHDAERPTAFTAQREFVIPRGTPFPPMMGIDGGDLLFDLHAAVHWVAMGALQDGEFHGTWTGEIAMLGQVFRMHGPFVLRFENAFGPIPAPLR